ncbi:MAG: DUF4256 domain-containing protein [Sphingobacterium sp.]
MANKKSNSLTQDEQQELLAILSTRFNEYSQRHQGISWSALERRLLANSDKLVVLQQMELSGGEPDVIGQDSSSGEYLFVDCSKESPAGRRSMCYDRQALEARKSNKPANTVMDMTRELGSQLLSEQQYLLLQELGEFDNKTSGWITTPSSVRKKGGALFCDRRYGQVFTYHNGADSYYAARGFRTFLYV